MPIKESLVPALMQESCIQLNFLSYLESVSPEHLLFHMRMEKGSLGSSCISGSFTLIKC